MTDLETLRPLYAQLIDQLAARGLADPSRDCARLAVQHGIWRDPLQRPTHFEADLAGNPLPDPQQFWIVHYLEEHYPTIRAELDRVIHPQQAGFSAVEEPLLSQGRWDEAVFYEGGHRFDEVCRRFPATAAIIEALPREALEAGVIMFSWLHPGSHIFPHCGRTNTRLRIHLGVRIPEGVSMRVGVHTFSWREGRCTVFDDSFEHEVWHRGTQPRIVFLFDIYHPDLSPDQKRRSHPARTGFEERIKSFMNERGLAEISLEPESGRLHLKPDDYTEKAIRRYMQGNGLNTVRMLRGDLEIENRDT